MPSKKEHANKESKYRSPKKARCSHLRKDAGKLRQAQFAVTAHGFLILPRQNTNNILFQHSCRDVIEIENQKDKELSKELSMLKTTEKRYDFKGTNHCTLYHCTLHHCTLYHCPRMKNMTMIFLTNLAHPVLVLLMLASCTIKE